MATTEESTAHWLDPDSNQQVARSFLTHCATDYGLGQAAHMCAQVTKPYNQC